MGAILPMEFIVHYWYQNLMLITVTISIMNHHNYPNNNECALKIDNLN